MFAPNENRYEKMVYNRLGNSGLKVSAVSLGLWQNFGFGSDFATAEEMVHTAFDLGITHFDIANNYGHPYNGSAEENFGKILDRGMREYRDELCISTKAGYEMWDGPYGDKNGSRKYLTASLDQSLKRMKLDYVDIYYHHIFDPDTPLEETALALADITRRGKALYVGISNYNGKKMHKMHHRCEDFDVPFIINQNRYSILDRTVEKNDLKKEAKSKKKGLIAFSPLAQGQLTDKCANGIPENSRLYENRVLWEKVGYNEARQLQITQLYNIAKKREQTLSQLAVQWLLQYGEVTSVLIGVHSKAQLVENLKALECEPLTKAEILQINAIAGK